ncbi:membrane protease YdiL (CAAX protease family) [Chryseobacterium vietnamense]|uniref:Membrane protease YdiL (CAAX protease family) n=1 Tax=Chryseobacterium vietnamense TaxID=866785 RepID=A0ACC6J8W2_9FLAO|nr:CPBP family glutamic-type intramembrane protease [Chryseobacterium vietnamense]MDR6459270.1 membrane protease YdiL (CAAX protease family) [Chryseobacterium vietnamense]
MPNARTSVFIELLKFIYNPDEEKEQNSSIYRKIYKTVVLFIVSFPLTLILSIVITYITNKSVKIHESAENYDFTLFILTCLIVPLIEEVAFRLPLRYSKISLSLSITVLSFYTINYFFTLKDHFDTENYFFLRIVFSILVGIFFYLFCLKYSNSFVKLYKNNFNVIFYFFSVLFAIMHISNYEFTLDTLLIAPIITLPKLISSFVGGFVRVKYGFLYCLFLHSFHNTIPFLIISTKILQ